MALGPLRLGVLVPLARNAFEGLPAGSDIFFDLGESVTLATERGSRDFARGDRIMFLKNERGLGVKNGSLGRIESVSTARMAVMLDDGRAVAFDLKDYNQIDHGYAATIHKAQGVTVDRAYVLATPGLDRHAAYVALSRHRDSVRLHYGADDFADETRLVRTLSRERSKDMASDYTHPVVEQVQVAPPSPAKPAASRDIFANLDLRPFAERVRAAAEAPSVAKPAPAPAPDRWRSPKLATAIRRHATIVREMRAAHAVEDPYTPEQRRELRASRASLTSVHPHAVHDLEAALSNDKGLIAEAAAGRTAATLRAMQLEAEMRDDPRLRADVFVQRWQALERQRRQLMEYHEDSKVACVSDRMIGMAKSLERDPQVESILRNRRVALGLPAYSDRSVGQSLGDLIGHGPSRGISIGM